MALDLQKLSTIEATLMAKYPNMKANQKEAITKILNQKRAELLTAGGVQPSDIPTNPLGQQMVEQQVGAGIYQPGDSAAQAKELAKMKSVEQALSVLKPNLAQAEVTGPIMGNLGLLANKITGGGAAPEVADYESLRKSLIGPLARAISGEVGVLTDKDIARAEGLLPKITDAKKLRENKLKNLEQLISVKSGSKATKVGKFTIEAIE